MATEVKRKRGPVDRKAASLATKLYRQRKIGNLTKTAEIKNVRDLYNKEKIQTKGLKDKQEKKQPIDTESTQSQQHDPDELRKSALISLMGVIQDARTSKDKSLFVEARTLITNTDFDNLLISIHHQVNLQVDIKVVDMAHFKNMKDMAVFVDDNLLLTALDSNAFYLGIASMRGGIVYGLFIFQTLRLAMEELKQARLKLIPEQATEPSPQPVRGINAIQWFEK